MFCSHLKNLKHKNEIQYLNQIDKTIINNM